MANDPAIAPAFAELDGVIERMTVHGSRQYTQDREAKHGTERVGMLARTLRNDLVRPVALLVKTINPEAVPQAPGKGALSLPRVRDLEGIMSAAKGFHDVALPHEERLLAAGLPKEHLRQLLAGVVALKEAIDARAQMYLQRSVSGNTVVAEAMRATTILRLIDALVLPRLRGDAGQLAAWNQARRVVRTAVGTSVVSIDPAATPVAVGAGTEGGVPIEGSAKAA